MNTKKLNMDNLKCCIVAELSANHNGSLELALDSIKAIKRTGADAVKLQTYTPETITLDIDNNDFIIKGGTLWDSKKLFDLYKEAYTPWEWHPKLYEAARDEGLICFSSPFDKSAVDLLESLETPIYKIASFEITDIPLIEYVAQKGKPVVMSTGIATEEDIELALAACRNMGNNDITLLKCTSSYPAPFEEANLVMIKDMAIRYGVKTGLSDHTLGATAPILSIAMGAKMIEKHFIIDRGMGGVDSTFSMNEEEFMHMVKSVREAEKALGVVDYNLTPKQANGKDFSRSLYIVKDMKEGDVFTEETIRSIRPGFGLHPKHLSEILGKKTKVNLKKGDRMEINFIDSPFSS